MSSGGKPQQLAEHLHAVCDILVKDYDIIATVKEHRENMPRQIAIIQEIKSFSLMARKLDTPEGSKAVMACTASILNSLSDLATYKSMRYNGLTFEEIIKDTTILIGDEKNGKENRFRGL